jgi:TolB-like protein/Tfp pilus assembly protein PilF
MPNKLSQFWQELKRRNVVRVITVYAGAAFVIIELINNITEPLRLPEWTPTLVIVLLAIGFPIVIIFSWIYDIHPEGGMVKTEPADKVKAEEKPASSNSWKIASYISFVVIAGLIVLNVIPRTGKNVILDKSIAVMPFVNDSPNTESEYIINGYMASVHDKLCRIQDLKVLVRTSTEQYKNISKPIREVARELHVGYLLTASGQIYNNKVRLIVQLLDADENIIWSNPYDRQINDVDDHIDIQSEIAQLVADELQATITPDEKILIERKPTTSLVAYNLYQRGIDEYYRGNISRAEELFVEALNYDSSFAEAYVGLGYIARRIQGGILSIGGDSLITVMTLANKALSLDDRSSGAYTLRAQYYFETGNIERALEDLDRAIELNPNNAEAYRTKSDIYYGVNHLEAIKAIHLAEEISRGPELYNLMYGLALHYMLAGFIGISDNYLNEALQLEGDSVSYYFMKAQTADFVEDYSNCIEYSRKAIELGGAFGTFRHLATALWYTGNHKEALEVFKEWYELLERYGVVNEQYNHRVAYAYWINGFQEKAEYYFDRQIETSFEMINSNRPWASKYFTYYDLAGVYAFRGEKEKAYEYLRIFNRIEDVPLFMVTVIKRDELFDSIRDEPEFQQISREVEAKYQAGHERVRQWLEENDLL